METNDEVMKMLKDLKVQSDSIFDDKTRAEYINGIAKLYDADVRRQALEAAKSNADNENRFREKEIENEKRKAKGETAAKIIDAGLRFIGTMVSSAVGGFSILAFLKCWKEGMEFEEKGVFSSSNFKDLRHNLKLPKLW